MTSERGIIPLYDGFRRHLGKDAVKNRIVPLQFTGRLEDCLVKEFVTYVFHASRGRRFAEVNQGRRGQQKVDIAILRRDSAGGPVVESLVEAKYLMNRHRRSDDPWGAMDELKTVLRSLQKQLALKPTGKHGSHQVHLRGRSTKVYGLVFASYTRMACDEDLHSSFFRRVLEEAAGFGLRYHDHARPYLDRAYRDESVEILGDGWLASLNTGLWRL